MPKIIFQPLMISYLTSQLPGQADSNAGTTIAFRPKMLYLCIVNETH